MFVLNGGSYNRILLKEGKANRIYSVGIWDHGDEILISITGEVSLSNEQLSSLSERS
jgi:hypothetical protein